SYIDFLNIYFGGPAYGLDNLNRAKLILLKPSYLNQQNLREVKMDSLHIAYKGNVLDAVVAVINEVPFSSDHSVNARSPKISIRFPQTIVSGIAAKNFRYSGKVREGKNEYWKDGVHDISADSLTWTPSEAFQNTYRFFI